MDLKAAWSKDHEGIRPLLPEERTYGFFDLFWNWFGDGANASSWYFGGLLAMLGVPFLLWNTFFWTPLIILPWACLAFMSFRTGGTTVVLARPVLGMLGGTFILGSAEILVQLGWTTVTTYIGAVSLVHLWEGGETLPGSKGGIATSLMIAILLLALVQGGVAALGSGAIKALKWMASLLLLVAGGVETFHILAHWSIAKIFSYRHESMIFTAPHLLDISFINIWTWLQVGDFARFSKTRNGAVLGSWLGLWSGQTWFVLIGAISVIGLGIETGHLTPDDSDPSRLMSRLGLSSVALSVIFLSCVSVSTSNLYGAGMALLSLLGQLKARKFSAGMALGAVSLIQVATAFIPFLLSSFIEYFTDFLTAIGGIFIPLWSLVLADYFLIRKRNLDSSDLFNLSESSRYWARGGFNIAGVTTLVLGIFFYYGFPRIFPGMTNSFGISLPTILWTIALYPAVMRLVRIGSPPETTIPTKENIEADRSRRELTERF